MPRVPNPCKRTIHVFHNKVELLKFCSKRKHFNQMHYSDNTRGNVRNPGRDILFQYLPEKKLKQKELEKKSKQ